MKKRLTWLWETCVNGKTCPRVGRLDDGRRIVQGYIVTDPGILAEIGELPAGEVVLILPAAARLES